jgi:hypothetical protein
MESTPKKGSNLMAWNEQADAFLKAAGEQAKGKDPISQELFDGVIQEAGNATLGEKEQLLGALSGRIIDTMYTDSSWTDKYGDIFFQNSEQFGAIVQIINTEMPEVRQNRAWDQITSGETTIGSNVVYLPVVKEQLVGGTSSWAVPYAISGIQMDSAFRNASGLSRFIGYVQMSAENAIKYHLARMTAANRNNFIVEKIKKGNTATNVNCVSLTAEYNAMTGSSLTKQQFLNNQDGCLRMVNRIFKKYKALLTDMTTLFTLDSTTTGKFIPEDRFTFSLIGDFNALLESELYSTTYHDDFVKAKGFREVPSWQGLRSANTTVSFDDLTTINAGRVDSVLYDGGTAEDPEVDINQSGILGLMCDKWAIMHTVVRHRTGVQRDDIKDITLYEHQFTDRYVNNLMLNGLVFTI